MTGSMLIKENDAEKIKQFDAENSGEFLTLQLASLLTLDFVVIAGDANLEWTSKQPVFRDVDKGCCLFEIDPAGLAHITSEDCKLNAKQQSDQNLIRKFIEENGSDNIYEYATF